MTGTIKKAKERHQRSVANLQSYITSLLYLREEAKRDGLVAVVQILSNALAAIEQWLDSGQGPVATGDLLDSTLCHSLDFLLNWRALPQSKQRRVAKEIERYEAEAMQGAFTGGRGFSKKIAN